MTQQTNARLRAAVERVLDAADAAGVKLRSVAAIEHVHGVPGCSVTVGIGDLQHEDPRMRYPLPGTARAVLAGVLPGGSVHADEPYDARDGGPTVQSLQVVPADGVVYRVTIAALSPEVAADAVAEAVLAS